MHAFIKKKKNVEFWAKREKKKGGGKLREKGEEIQGRSKDMYPQRSEGTIK